MKKTIYIFQDGELHRKDNTLVLVKKDGKKYVPIENIQEILVFGEVSLNKKFLGFVSEHEVLVHYFNYYGYYMGTFYPREHYNSGHMLLSQVRLYDDSEKRLYLAKQFVIGAKKNVCRILNYYRRRGSDLEEIIKAIDNKAKGVESSAKLETLMNIEAGIKKSYYKAFDTIIAQESFVFEKRSRRPPLNRLNSLISFGNSLVYTYVLSEIYHTHLDPRLGYLHTSNFRRFTLNLDVAEIFKPVLADRVTFGLLNRKMLQGKHFEKRLNGVLLNEAGRKIFVEEMEKRLKTTIKHSKLGREVSYRRLIRMELYKLEKHLLGEEQYTPFVMDW